ncbi:YciI family protein [Streptomyces klenkii]|uniref:YciI family protein n=1 Tax=Streptomyces klenkii TaxID=1420899 RepID=UPI0033B1B38F
MKYLLLIYGNDEKWASIPDGVRDKAIAKQDAWNTRYRASGELLAAYGLGGESESSLVRNKDGAPFSTDGPYLEAKEFVCSLYVLEVESAERAREIAADMPWASESPVEMWPILHDGFAPKPDSKA